ncbi:MAG: hypothetical protein AAF629_10885, partial [Chloroflexota bacterium]
MDKQADRLLQKFQEEFENEYGIRIAEGNIERRGKRHWIFQLHSRDGTMSVTGEGRTEVDAIEDAFMKAKVIATEAGASSKGENPEAYNSSSKSGGIRIENISGGIHNSTFVEGDVYINQTGETESSHGDIENVDMVGGDVFVTQTGETVSPHSPIEIEGLADFQLENDIVSIFQAAAKLTTSDT